MEYVEEKLHENDDDGTMPENVQALRENVVGHRIVSVEQKRSEHPVFKWRNGNGLEVTLDNGKKVHLVNTDDCCAYTELDSFLLNAENIDHVITGVGTTDEYTKWHIYADMGDVLELSVDWSPGNPFYYGYGFDISVVDVTE